MPLKIPIARLLDVRPSSGPNEPPIAGAAWIPAAELAGKVSELPRRGCPLLVAGAGTGFNEAIGWLTKNGWPAAVSDFSFANDSPPMPRLWSPTEFLLEAIEHLVPGAAIDLACGTGRDAVFLASEGWNVTAIDLLPDALAKARALGARYLPSGSPPVHWVQADLEKVTPDVASANLVCCFRFLDRNLLCEVARRLTPGSHVVIETFTVENFLKHGKPSKRHSLEPGELASIFAGFKIQRESEGWRHERHTARLWAIKGD